MSDNTLGVIIIIGIIFIAILSGGEIFKSGELIQPEQSEVGGGTSNTFYTSDPPVTGAPTAGVNSNLSPEMQLRQIEEQLRLLQIEVEKELENRNSSVYKGKVNMTYVPGWGSFLGYIDVYSSYGLGESVKITGWRIRSTVSGNEQVIGTAVSLPYFESSERDVVLPPNGRVIISQFGSPIGMSFRVNKCMGFLAQNTNFSPTLRTYDCPAVKAPPLSNEFNNTCLDYIERFPRCKVPSENDFPETLTHACRNFLLTQISYNQCVARHKNDLDFYKNEWRIYPSTPRFLWLDRRESLQLIDSNGKIVDTYSN